MEVDYEIAWRELQEYILDKRSHGQRDLIVEMTRIELRNRVDSGGASLPPRRTPDGRTPGSPPRIAAA